MSQWINESIESIHISKVTFLSNKKKVPENLFSEIMKKESTLGSQCLEAVGWKSGCKHFFQKKE